MRYLWALPASCIGLAVASFVLISGARGCVVEGVLEVGGGRLSSLIKRLPYPCRFEAITLGHVVIGIDRSALSRSRMHERVHVAQYERWGVFFFVLYLGSSLIAFMRGRDPYRDNHFERQAVAQTCTHGAPTSRG